MKNDRSLCNNCRKNCSSCLKSELAMRGCLSYIYLKNGDKMTYACKLYTTNMNIAVKNPLISMQQDLSLMNFNNISPKFV